MIHGTNSLLAAGMTVPKKQHFVPQMLLNGFTDGAGWLHWTRTQDPVIRRARPAELFHKNHFYSTVSAAGVKDPLMERFLSLLEQEAAQIIRVILADVRAGRIPDLSPDQRSIWHFFFLVQWRRTPENQKSCTSDAEATKMLHDILDEVREKLPEKASEIEALSQPEAVERTIRNVRVQSLLRLSTEVMSVLERRGISILRITNPKKSFIIGSRPVVKLTSPGRTDLNDPRVEMWLPISSDIAVGAGQGDGAVSVFMLGDGRPVRQLNEAIAAQSGTVAAGSPALVRSITRQR
jgi:hypothetical protein